MKTKIVFLLFALNLFLLPHYFSQGCNPTDLNCYINNGDVNYLRNPQIPFEINYSVNEQSNSITLRMKFNRSDNNCPNIFPNFFASLTSVTSSQQATTVSWLRNSVDGLIEEVNYHENEPYSNNGQLFYDWSYVIELDDNTSTQDRQFFLYYYYYDNGVQKILQEFLIKQNPSILYYLDSDKDGFGDYDAEGVLSAVPIEGDYVSTNNYDQCPNDPYPANNGCRDSEDVDFNWIETKTYNIKKNLLSNSRNYFDQLGKPIQTQSYDIKEKRIWSTQTLYDEQGRPALQTLSAPITSKNTTKSIQYYSDFIKNEQGNKFPTFNGVSDLLLNQKTVGIGVNTLGWYYSTNNTDEPYQDITDRPYSRTIYSTLNPGTVKQTIGGNKVKDTNNDGFVDDDDDWVQGYSFSMPAAQEMYYVFGYDHFETSPDIATTYTIPESITNDSSKQINWLKATKTVIEDVQGNQSVVFTDTDGKTLAAARVGISETPGKIERKFNVLSLIGTQKYIDVHIPQGCTGVLRGSSSNYKVYNLKTEISNTSTPSTLSSGFYRIEYIGTTELTKEHQLTYLVKNTQTIAPVKSDAVGISYQVNYYDFSINYYNKTGQLVASNQPLDFDDTALTQIKSASAIKHTKKYIEENPSETNLLSTFSYNSLGQLLSTKSPDEGTANFKYRKDGQIRFSQNSKQLAANEFSYTNYDEFGRPTESGVSSGSFSGLNGDTSSVTGTKEQHFTEYDFLSSTNKTVLESNTDTDYHSPSFLAGNVSSTWNLDTNGTKISQTFYSYDLYGRVKWIVQKLHNFYGSSTKTVTIDYVYDPVTSQVTSVIYQKDNSTEYFEHKYSYNIAQELEKVETRTSNNGTFIPHADYQYYETGSLKRTTLAGGIQDTDYVYNLAGQLKAINHPNLTDPKDLFGMTLDYYTGDYKRNTDFNVLSTSGTDQFNGNIKGISWNSKLTSTETPVNPVRYHYEYNKNNWLTDAIFNGNGNTQNSIEADVVLSDKITAATTIKATNSITLNAGFEVSSSFIAVIENVNERDIEAGDYNITGITYDANGNIKSLNRNKNTETINGVTSNKMDQLSYSYNDETNTIGNKKNPNQLRRVWDAVTESTNAFDIKRQTLNENYKYNSIGQLTRNYSEDIYYKYNASGLVTEVGKNGKVRVEFLYNDKGFRTKKISYSADGTIDKTTNYILDAAGSTLAIYENNVLKELPIYGASRLGVYKKPSNTSVYQLTDHLGNVRAVIAKNGNDAIAITQTDYYPFGMPMPGRKIVNGEPYRYAYQGQEKDPETGKEAFQLRLWDARIGRWLTTDPYRQFESPYLGMGNNPIVATDPDGGYCDDGKGNTIVCPEKYAQFENTDYGVTPLFFLAKNAGIDLSNDLSSASQPGFNSNNVFGFTAGQFMTSMKSEFDRNGSPEASDGILNTEKTVAGFAASFVLPELAIESASFYLTASSLTTAEGFLLGSVGFKLPINLRVGLYASENTLKYGSFKWSTIAPSFLTRSQTFGRRMLQITSDFQPVLGKWSTQIIPKGTHIRIGLVGPQSGSKFGTWLQIYAPNKVPFIK